MKPTRYLGEQLQLLTINYFTAHIPIYTLRKTIYRLFGAKVGKRTIIDMGAYLLTPSKLRIGNSTHINHDCMLNARGGLYIGNNVSVSHHVRFCSSGHDYNSDNFAVRKESITVGDNVWIGLGAVILLGVNIGEGAVIAAGAVVTKDCKPWTVYGGVPAKEIGKRTVGEVKYDCTAFLYTHGVRKPYLR